MAEWLRGINATTLWWIPAKKPSRSRSNNQFRPGKAMIVRTVVWWLLGADATLSSWFRQKQSKPHKTPRRPDKL
jgi:hypothetical protein